MRRREDPEMNTRRLLTLVLLTCACGGPPATPPDDDTAGGEDTVPSPPTPWAQMSLDDRRSWMMNEVVSRMSAHFQEFDGERYSGFGCATCHGPNAEERNFDMPSPALPALYPTGTPQQQQMVREYPEMVRFMFQRVLPTMQTLLGAPDFNQETGEGFSCYACHPHAGDEGTTPIRLGEAPPAEDAGQ
jgi:hypothetical protein